MTEYYQNKKNGKLYRYRELIINATNAQNRQQMVLYTSLESGESFCREVAEFHEKFIPQ